MGSQEGENAPSAGGDQSKKDNIFENRPGSKKVIRVITVMAYMVSVSFVAIVLSGYYIFLWQPPNPRLLHRAHLRADPQVQYRIEEQQEAASSRRIDTTKGNDDDESVGIFEKRFSSDHHRLEAPDDNESRFYEERTDTRVKDHPDVATRRSREDDANNSQISPTILDPIVLSFYPARGNAARRLQKTTTTSKSDDLKSGEIREKILPLFAKSIVNKPRDDDEKMTVSNSALRSIEEGRLHPAGPDAARRFEKTMDKSNDLEASRSFTKEHGIGGKLGDDRSSISSRDDDDRKVTTSYLALKSIEEERFHPPRPAAAERLGSSPSTANKSSDLEISRSFVKNHDIGEKIAENRSSISPFSAKSIANGFRDDAETTENYSTLKSVEESFFYDAADETTIERGQNVTERKFEGASTRFNGTTINLVKTSGRFVTGSDGGATKNPPVSTDTREATGAASSAFQGRTIGTSIYARNTPPGSIVQPDRSGSKNARMSMDKVGTNVSADSTREIGNFSSEASWADFATVESTEEPESSSEFSAIEFSPSVVQPESEGPFERKENEPEAEESSARDASDFDFV